jgi:hypothetical protein
VKVKNPKAPAITREAEEDLGALNGPNRKIKTRIVDNPTCTLAQFAICSAHNERPPLPAAVVHRVAACVLDRNAPWPTTVL